MPPRFRGKPTFLGLMAYLDSKDEGDNSMLVWRVGSDFTVRFWDNDVCLLLPRLFFVLVMSRG